MPDTPARPANVFSDAAIVAACLAFYGDPWNFFPAQYRANQREQMRLALNAADVVHKQDELRLLGDILDNAHIAPAATTEQSSVERSGAVPAGYVLVPIEPTTAMLDAFHNGQFKAKPDGDYYGQPTYSAEGMYRAGYAAMLAAAPEPQQTTAPHHGDAPVCRALMTDLEGVGKVLQFTPLPGLAQLEIGEHDLYLRAAPVSAPAAAPVAESSDDSHEFGADNWAHQALLKMDVANGLVNWACVSMEKERYERTSSAFWEVAHMLAAERQRIEDARSQASESVGAPADAREGGMRCQAGEVARVLAQYAQPGDRVIWRDAFRWHDENGVLPNHFEGMDLPALAQEFCYEIVADYGSAAIVRSINSAMGVGGGK